MYPALALKILLDIIKLLLSLLLPFPLVALSLHGPTFSPEASSLFGHPEPWAELSSIRGGHWQAQLLSIAEGKEGKEERSWGKRGKETGTDGR